MEFLKNYVLEIVDFVAVGEYVHTGMDFEAVFVAADRAAEVLAVGLAVCDAGMVFAEEGAGVGGFDEAGGFAGVGETEGWVGDGVGACVHPVEDALPDRGMDFVVSEVDLEGGFVSI